MVHRNFLVIITIFIMAHAFMASPVLYAQVEPGKEPGILGPPAVENGIVYFVHWPETLYAFDENTNEIRWTGTLDPLLEIDNFDPADLPIPAPVTANSYVIVHIANQLWVVSKIDGLAAWHIDKLPPASRRIADATSNTFPGFYPVETGSDGGLITLEEESGFWFCRRRMLGNGNIAWENRIPGEPRAWWYDRDSVWIAYELFGESGPGSASDKPGVIVCLDPDDGGLKWSTPVIDNAMIQGAFRVEDSRVYLVERTADGAFAVRAFNETSGELYKEISYYAGNYMETLVSGDKIVFLHEDGSPEHRQAKFHLYYSSLNPIKFQTLMLSRDDQLFSTPQIDRNLFLYAGASYSVYDGRLVWQEHIQRKMVDWASDDYMIYIWDSAGFLLGLDRLTTQEMWRTQFNVLPSESSMGPNHGGASLKLADGRLFAGTPAGELVRIDTSTGELHPAVLRVTSQDVLKSNGRNGGAGTGGGFGSLWLWISLLIVASLAGFFLWFSLRKPSRWDDQNAKPGF